ncbi:Regulatory protein MgsR [bioreactor metagenome]|uniref:Regulatory protein MgsR n=1 Tax=bioreactor metagenome TaxID=1076179 RepID=A0A645JP96_9ZZZZ
MAYLFICYPKCSTCRKAAEFLDSRGVEYRVRDISTDNPTEEELRKWVAASGLPLRRFFNTSGLVYRAEKLSERLPSMSDGEQFRLLASNGMLVKRPLLVGDDGSVRVGFRPAEWNTL